MTTIETIAQEHCTTTEGPLWNDRQQALCWVDIPLGRLYRWSEKSGVELVREGPVVGGYTFQEDDSILLFGDRGRISILRDGGETVLRESLVEEQGSRFNDVIADPEGRVFCGTMPDGNRPGRLWRMDPDGSLTVVLEDAGLSNGMGFTPDLSGFYHTDSAKGTITAFDYDRRTGAISNPRTILRIPSNEGVPDGMTVAADGTIWSGIWDGHVLRHLTSAGAELGRVRFPAPKVSSITFGGPDWSEAYVTLAGGDDPATQGDAAGSVVRVNLGATGRPPFRSAIGLR